MVIEELRSTFVRMELPELIVTDNRTCFKSEESEEFLRRNGIKHVTPALYHLDLNGLAERAVQISETRFEESNQWFTESSSRNSLVLIPGYPSDNNRSCF